MTQGGGLIFRPAIIGADIARIKGLPRRTFTEADTQALVTGLTDALKRPGGTMTLNGVQAQALHDFAECGGGFGAMGVGLGKTLVSLLAPVIMQAKRPILVIPATLRTKTAEDQARYDKHFRVARNVRFVSYEELGRVSAAKLLDLHRPDLIILDEAHRAKNTKAGVTRRIARYMEANPGTQLIAMGGTMIKRSILDFAHILRWALKDGAPIPLSKDDTNEWAQALDHRDWVTVSPGRLLELCATQDATLTATENAREGFRDRLTSTPGVIAADAPEVNASLRITGLEYHVNQATRDNFEKLRTLWEAPTGWAISEAIIVWMLARQLSLGLHYEFSPLAPKPWLEARKLWAKFVRTTLARSRTYDTELQVANAVDAGHLQSEELKHWRRIRPTFEPNSIPIWHDDSALKTCEAWAAAGPGIIFCGHDFFARELAKRTGLRYYGAGGLHAPSKESIERGDGKRCIIASQAANGTGRNLQAFSRALVTALPSGPDAMEQLLGRLHRQGQASDEVEYTLLVGCLEHVSGFWRAREAATAVGQLTGAQHKVTYADIVGMPETDALEDWDGWQWKKGAVT